MRAYLDHAATTPVRAEALAAWRAAAEMVGNPSSIHAAGREARETVESARQRVAEAFGADAAEVAFVSGGTEAVNLGIQGLWRARRREDPRRTRILLPDGEHAATFETVAWLAEHEGAVVDRIRLDPVGRIRLDDVAEALARDPGGIALATALWASNEIGTVQPVVELVALAAAVGVPVHLDAVAAAGQVPVSLGASGAAAASVSGHKFGAPIGSGALLLARSARVEPLLHGGEQQRARSGTEDVAGAAALGVAAELAVAELEATAARMRGLRDRLVAGARDAVPDLTLYGDDLDRLPGNASLGIPGADGESLLFLLDAAGIAVSTGSACRAGIAEPSHVLLALGRDEVEARRVIRVSLGRTSTDDDVAAFLEALPTAVEGARRAGRT